MLSEGTSESAVTDESDPSDWEDSVTDHSDMDDKQLFQRVDPRPVATCRSSHLTTALQEAAILAVSVSSPALSAQTSRTSHSHGPCVSVSAQHIRSGNTTTLRSDVPPSISITPRTTRRGMLATELTGSLRKHLLWERQQKLTTLNAVSKRRHAATDALKPDAHTASKENDSWNRDLDCSPWDEYHVRGW